MASYGGLVRAHRLKSASAVTGEARYDPPMGTTDRVPLSPAAAAARRREDLLARGWPTSIAVGEALGASNPAQFVAELRAAGALLGAWSAPQGTFVHPDCQFDPSGNPLPVMRELLSILPSSGDEGGWRRTFWLYGERDALGGLAPADLLRSDARQVLELARLEFSSSDRYPIRTIAK